MLGLHVRHVPAEDGRDDPVAEDAIEVGSRALDVCDPGLLVGAPRVLPDESGERGDVVLCVGVERQVAVVTQDDRVGLMRVLVAHGARELERNAHAFLVVLHLEQAVVDLPDVGKREVGRERERRDEQSERDEEPLRGAEGSPHLPDGLATHEPAPGSVDFGSFSASFGGRVTRAVTPSRARRPRSSGTGGRRVRVRERYSPESSRRAGVIRRVTVWLPELAANRAPAPRSASPAAFREIRAPPPAWHARCLRGALTMRQHHPASTDGLRLPLGALAALLLLAPQARASAQTTAALPALPTDPVLDPSSSRRASPPGPSCARPTAALARGARADPAGRRAPRPRPLPRNPERRLQGDHDREDGDELLPGDAEPGAPLAREARAAHRRGAPRRRRGRGGALSRAPERRRRTSGARTSTSSSRAIGSSC